MAALAAAIAALADSRARFTDASLWMDPGPTCNEAGSWGCGTAGCTERAVAATSGSTLMRAEKGTGTAGGEDAECDAAREMRMVSGGDPNGEGSRGDGTRWKCAAAGDEYATPA